MSVLTKKELDWLALKMGKIVNVRAFKLARTNQVFLLTDENGQQNVFKRLNLKARTVRKRKDELAVQDLASTHGLSPKVLADCLDYRLQNYIQGEVLASTSADALQQLAAQLGNIHQLPALHAQPQSLSSELKLLKKELDSIDKKRFNDFFSLAETLDKSALNKTLCHGDLSFNNLIETPDKKLKILDWEYAVLACPAYDLAACSCINKLTLEQQTQLIEHYYLLHKKMGLSLKKLQRQCASYFVVFTYLNELWEAVHGK